MTRIHELPPVAEDRDAMGPARLRAMAVVMRVIAASLVVASPAPPRPDSENDALIALLERNANDLPPPFLYELARRLWARNPDVAFEWYAVAFIRGVYDGERCSDRTARQGLDYVRNIADNVIDGIVR